MEANPLSIILVKSDSKGDRLLFRYPYKTSQNLESSKTNKKKNPFSVALIEDVLQSQIPESSNIHNGQLSGISDDVLSTLFAVKKELCNQKFELKVNDVRFVSHPAIMQSNSSYILINIVFALHAQCSYSIVKCYYELSKRLGLALLYEENRSNYLSKEMKTMLQIHETEKDEVSSTATSIFDTILAQSPLAQCLKTMYNDLSTTGLLNITLNDSITLCFCLPQKAHQFHKKGSFVEPEVIDKSLRALKPFHGFLLLVDPSELLDCVPPSAAHLLLQLIEIYNPLKSLQSMATDSDLSLEHVIQLVSHLVYWAKATIIYPLCETNVYVISPDATLHVHSSLVEKFSTKFPGMSLFEVISDFSLPTSIGHLTTPLQHPARQGRLAQMVLWMLQYHLLMQLHTYVQFMPANEMNSKGIEKLGEPKSGPKLTTAISAPLAVPHSASQLTLDFGIKTQNGDQAQSSKSSYNPPSCSKSFQSSSINETDEATLKDLLNSFDEADREAIQKVPAASNPEDLSLMVRLWKSGYFKGEHHLEEIMYFENLRRSQLLQLLDKFREVLIIYETEDPATCSLSF